MTNNNPTPYTLGLIILFNDSEDAFAGSTPRAIARVLGHNGWIGPRLEVHNRTSNTAGQVTAIVGRLSFSSSLSLSGSPLEAARRVLALANIDEPVSLPQLFAEMGLT